MLARGLLQKAIKGRLNSMVGRRLVAGGRAGTGAQAGASHDAQSGSSVSAQDAKASDVGTPDVVLSATGKPFPDARAAKRRLRATGKNPDQFEIRETDSGFIAIPAQAAVRQVLSSTQEDDVSKKKQDGAASGAILPTSGSPCPVKVRPRYVCVPSSSTRRIMRSVRLKAGSRLCRYGDMLLS